MNETVRFGTAFHPTGSFFTRTKEDQVMKAEETRSRDWSKDERALLHRLTHLAKQMSRGNYSRAGKLFEMTVQASHSRPIAELAEAIGMMIVRVESREFKLEQLVEELGHSCKEMTAAKKSMDAFNGTLGQKVTARTEQLHRKNEELSLTMQDLKREIRDRKQAEKNLSQLNLQIEETNRKLQDAYVWMRQQKDHWAARRYTESMIFITADDGRIHGFTEKALELTRKSRSEVQGGNIQDFFVSRDGNSFTHLVRRVRPNIAHLTTLGLKGRPGTDAVYDAKLTRIQVNGERLAYLVLYDHPKQQAGSGG